MSRHLRILTLVCLLPTLSGCDFFKTILGIDSCDDRSLYDVLAEDGLDRDERCDEDFEEFLLAGSLTQADIAMTQGLSQDFRWASWIRTLKSAAGISSLVNVDVVTDMRTTWTEIAQYGGGVTGHNIVIVDGKFLDILLDIATYRGLVDEGLLPEDYFNAADAVVARHMSYLGATPPVFDIRTVPAAAQARAETHFAGLAGAILYHEFGHYFLAHMREKYAQSFSIFVRSEKHEDQSDDVAGALSRKAGHDLPDVREMFDLMAFYTANKLPFYNFTSLRQVKGDFRIQFGVSNPRYSSLAARKDIAEAGYRTFSPSAGASLQLSVVEGDGPGYPDLPAYVGPPPAGWTPTPVPAHLRWPRETVVARAPIR